MCNCYWALTLAAKSCIPENLPCQVLRMDWVMHITNWTFFAICLVKQHLHLSALDVHRVTSIPNCSLIKLPCRHNAPVGEICVWLQHSDHSTWVCSGMLAPCIPFMWSFHRWESDQNRASVIQKWQSNCRDMLYNVCEHYICLSILLLQACWCQLAGSASSAADDALL